jgi:hypothetical protein
MPDVKAVACSSEIVVVSWVLLVKPVIYRII